MDKLKEWEEIIENIEKEEIEAPDAKAIEYDPSNLIAIGMIMIVWLHSKKQILMILKR